MKQRGIKSAQICELLHTSCPHFHSFLLLGASLQICSLSLKTKLIVQKTAMQGNLPDLTHTMRPNSSLEFIKFESGSRSLHISSA